jgi:hypothetical protein
MKKSALPASDRGIRLYSNEGLMMDTPPEREEDFANLYRRAFAEYGTQALWNKRTLQEPTPDDALAIARALRVEGNRTVRKLAEQIEQACRRAAL